MKKESNLYFKYSLRHQGESILAHVINWLSYKNYYAKTDRI